MRGCRGLLRCAAILRFTKQSFEDVRSQAGAWERVKLPPKVFLNEFDDVAEQDVTQTRLAATDAGPDVGADCS